MVDLQNTRMLMIGNFSWFLLQMVKKYCINNTQLREFIADEDWINGEANTLSKIASNRTISLSWGSKKKDTENSACKVSPCNNATLLSVG